MNDENIDEQLLRTVRERDEAQGANILNRNALRSAKAEIARLRAAANERAIAELQKMVKLESRIATADGRYVLAVPSTRIEQNIAAIRAEQPAPVPPPVTHCEFCNGSLADGTEGHGLGECVPVCPTCDGSGTAKPPATSGWLHDLAFLGFAPHGRMSYGVNRFGGDAAGNPVFDLDFADLQRELRRILAQPPATPPADAPSRPSVEALRKMMRKLVSGGDLLDVRDAAVLLLDDALAGRGGAQ